MDFGDAIKLVRQGNRVKRHDWGGYWFIPKYNVRVHRKTGQSFTNANDMIMAQIKDNGGLAPATPYMADMLADDWELAGSEANDTDDNSYDSYEFQDAFGHKLTQGDYVYFAHRGTLDKVRIKKLCYTLNNTHHTILFEEPWSYSVTGNTFDKVVKV